MTYILIYDKHTILSLKCLKNIISSFSRNKEYLSKLQKMDTLLATFFDHNEIK